jgi:NADPH-dependent glutamate synthase beta subunit-like oxidoreductase
MNLDFGFEWHDLYNAHKLAELHRYFLKYLQENDQTLYNEVVFSDHMPLIPLAMAIEAFIVELFKLEAYVQGRYDAYHSYRLASHFKRNFVQRDALYAYALEDKIKGDEALLSLSEHLGQYIDPTDEITFAKLGLAALSREDIVAVKLFRQYSAWAYYSKEGQARHHQGFLFKKPSVINPQALFPVEMNQDMIVSPTLHNRDGFDLTDCGINTAHAVDEAVYCIKCHEREKDSCRSGMKTGNGFKSDSFGQALSGCPLDQKISEMNVLFEHGQLIAALAVVTLDNPMVAATGHRICYDCSRSCIFQKQDPVDIPSIETRLLKEVLDLPYGFEIYSLLTRWNPLNRDHPYPKPSSGYNVLIVGQGPAGFALAHLMMQYGHTVTAIDGLKIEPLSSELKDTSKPICNISEYYQRLSQRYAQGFGGVAEYGITVRWDKNFLFILRLLLERRPEYQCLDGVRFGSSLTFDTAFNRYGFDHIALCLGAGSPTILPLENVTAPGVRLASDFLMALHLGDAAKFKTSTTLRIQLPVAVVGAGLTAVDAATEALAYYPVQVMNFYERYHTILQQHGEDKAFEIINIDPIVATTFLEHGRVLWEEHNAAESERRKPNYLPYLNQWGGVTIYYRKNMQESPAYRLNPNELKSALAEGVRFVEQAMPTHILTGDDDRLDTVEFSINNHIQVIPTKTLLIAAGTKPNTILAEEFSELQLNGDFFRPIEQHNFFVSCTTDGRYVSYLGDLHPKYSGSVVKALASAKMAAPLIHTAMTAQPPQVYSFNPKDFMSFVQKIFVSEHIIELVISSPAAAKAYQSGQFFKLQPYGLPFTEAIPLSPVGIDQTKGHITFKIQMVGATTRKLRNLQVTQRVFLMGPAGSSFDIPANHRVLFVVDPAAAIDIVDPIKRHLKNYSHQIIANIDDIAMSDFKGFHSIFIVGNKEYVEAFKARHPKLDIPGYTFVYTHLQCMMKQVCAQCIYTVKDPTTGFSAVQFGCAKSIENIQKISYSAINKRNKNEVLEESLLDCGSINDSSRGAS